MLDQWLSLADKHSFTVSACIANSLRRGLVDAQERERYELPAVTIDERISLVGLGEIAEAYINGDRVLQF